MIERVINVRNMQEACIHVMRNKGSAGVDGMRVTALSEFVRGNKTKIAQALKYGDYKVQPILGFPSPRAMERCDCWEFQQWWIDGYSNAWHKRSRPSLNSISNHTATDFVRERTPINACSNHSSISMTG